MAKRSRPRGYTVLLMGAPGHRVRRLQLGRGTLVAASGLLIGLLIASAAAGYGMASAPGGVVAAAAPEAPATETAARATATPAPARAAATEPTMAAAATPEATPEATAQQNTPTAEAAPSDATLKLLPQGGGDTLELHPFGVDDSPRASAFQQLAQQLACSDGTERAPTPALVRALMRAQEHFERPALVLGGRCASHDDDSDSRRQHQAGRAVDVRLPGVSSQRLTDWLIEQGVGGVGRYGSRGFVHLDVRDGATARWEEPGASAESAEAEPRPARRRPPPVTAGDAPDDGARQGETAAAAHARSAPAETVETATALAP